MRRYFFELVRGTLVSGGLPNVAKPLDIDSIKAFLVHTGGVETISPKFSLEAGRVAFVHWGDGDVSAITGPVSMQTYSHTYTSAGDHYIRLSGDHSKINYILFTSMSVAGDIADLPSGLTTGYFGDTDVSGDIADLPSGLVAGHFWSTAVTGDIADLPSGLTTGYFGNTDVSGSIADLPSGLTTGSFYTSAVTGDIADLPSGLTTGHFYNTAVTGDIADLPSGLTTGLFQNSMVTCSAVNVFGIGVLRVNNNGYSQAQVDAIVKSIYDNWASFTDATPEIDISGTNATPSGTYQDGDPPTTGKEYIYEIVNDPESTGNYKWTITYNS